MRGYSGAPPCRPAAISNLELFTVALVMEGGAFETASQFNLRWRAGCEDDWKGWRMIRR